ncbi:MAG TPA: TonB-dependent receptor [Vicinamibacterales bacterium]|nr:TonB-dependent receptor [Vicinamibacterales bacterium]
MTLFAKPLKRALSAALAGSLLCGTVWAQDFPDVTAISLEDLMNLKVTSVSKREQKLGVAAAAIFVITQDDIRRSGARNIPEALRLAPGLEVARIDENKWAIAARGFNGRFTNKLLVLIDGRSVYTPLFSGVYWNVQDLLLEDVDRIEVIRGPGATLWGANAVNGVINIITKDASATQGGLVSAQAGTGLLGSGGARYGGKIGSSTSYRVYSKYFKWDSATDDAGRDAYDGWNTGRVGFRVDGGMSAVDTYTVQGDIYNGDYGETLTGPTLEAPYTTTFRNDGQFTGGNVLGRWSHGFDHSRTSLQVYFDRANSAATSLLDDHLNIYDVDFQHDINLSPSNNLIWGAGFRSTHDDAIAGTYVQLNPDQRTWNLFSAFTQDEFTLLKQRLRVTLGSKIERNDFTGFEAEPNGRVLLNISPTQSVWGAVSRAVRTPARTEQDMTLSAAVLAPSAETLGLPVSVRVLGDRDFKSEDMLAYETGYRVNLGRASVDAAAFYNRYSNLLSAEPTAPTLDLSGPMVQLVAPLVADNKMSGATYGSELFAEWKPITAFKLSGAYTYLRMNIDRDADSLDVSTPDPAGVSPKHQFSVRSAIDFGKNVQQDFTWRYVDSLTGLAVPSYYSLDARLGWTPVSHLNLSIAGQNLTNNEHIEFRPDFITTTPTVVKRTYQVMARWTF